MKKWFMAMFLVLAMFLGACGGPGIGDGTQEPDGNKVDKTGIKSFSVVFEEKGATPLKLWNFRIMSEPVIVKPGVKTLITLKQPQSSVELPVQAAFPGYIHPHELQTSVTPITVVNGKTTIIKGQTIPWLFRRRAFTQGGRNDGVLVPKALLDQVSWSDDGSLEINSEVITLYAEADQPFLIEAATPGQRINVQFRWDGQKFVPVSSNLKTVSISYLRDSQVPRAYTNLIKNKPQGAGYDRVSGDATWEVTLEGTDKQGRPFKKSYYALVAKPY